MSNRLIGFQKKIIALWLCIVLLCMTGCNGTASNHNDAKPQAEKKIQIGMTFDSFVIERWQRDRDVFVSMAKELGAEVNVQSANGDIDEQIRQIEYFIESGMDVIVIVCIDSNGLSDAVKKAKAAGVKVIAYDRLIRNADVDLYISFDNSMVGTLMANALIEAGVPDGGNVLMLGGDEADNNVSQVETAFREVMDRHNIQILDSTHAPGWRAELAADYVNTHKDIVSRADGIMCGNDNIASQAIHALAEQRMAGNIYVVGQDADLEACQRIVEGIQTMTVYKPVERLASQAAQCAVALANGDSMGDIEILTMNDGTYEVPYVKLDPVSVTAENMDEVIINGGFHLKEDVYLNAPD
ncbi:MAG: substrate-binding domain-containing protein [Eubacteriales bacterium]|nr:substrate-binding domain-containing protein [Lachnospiraceae bacterium]MDO5128029.1 substrate-binding domain-containing protein [Eubacteriales bacterium]